MGTFESIIIAVIIVALLFFLFQRIKRQPEAFSKTNLSQSAGVLGVLALALIAVIAVLVEMLK